MIQSFFYTQQYYTMDGNPDLWKIAYYPINECGKTGEIYTEPRALIEKPIEGGTDFREIPLRYLSPYEKQENYICPQCGVDKNGAEIHSLTHHSLMMLTPDEATRYLETACEKFAKQSCNCTAGECKED